MNTLTLAEFDKLKTIADIREALYGDDTYTELVESEDGPHGQVKRVHVTKNLLTDAVVETNTVEWSYYENGDVDEIVTSKKDGKNKKIGKDKKIKHHQDKQPTVSEK